MNFFKSVFADDHDSQPSHSSGSENSNPTNSTWISGGLLKTLATKSESVMESYKKEFEEFRSGLKKETDVIREVASRAVKDLPASFEIGASVAQESLESVGQAIDDIGASVWKSTAEIITHGKRNLLTPSSDQNTSDSDNNSRSSSRRLSDFKPYSRFEMQLHAIQGDYMTYCREPDDLEEYENWKKEFSLDSEKYEEIEKLIKENVVIGEIYGEVVNDDRHVDEETFWSRYFYKVHKLKQAEETRARLVKRAISMEEDEDLTWDIEDDNGNDAVVDEQNSGSLVKGETSRNPELQKREFDENDLNTINDENLKEEKHVVDENDNEKVDSCKDSDVSVVSTQPSMPEVEDLGWDEIEDIGSNDENKEDAIGGASRADLRKRLSAADEDEDLSWDIEDENDEPGKS